MFGQFIRIKQEANKLNLSDEEKRTIRKFIFYELNNEDMAKDLFDILNNMNIIECRYECNEHSVFFDREKDSVIIFDDISFENGVCIDNCKVDLSMQDFENILSKKNI